ncbi:hypothetical protein M1116_00405 [Patescibacteria group bacterium]|nr:hypothetical protein [Patescibacteria group bacterium]
MSIVIGLIMSNSTFLTKQVIYNPSFLNKLEFSLQSNNLTLSKSPDCQEFLDFCRLSIRSGNHDFIAMISTNNDPFFQIASLQKILKIATMNGKHAEFIDLSSLRPYATLKNN